MFGGGTDNTKVEKTFGSCLQGDQIQVADVIQPGPYGNLRSSGLAGNMFFFFHKPGFAFLMTFKRHFRFFFGGVLSGWRFHVVFQTQPFGENPIDGTYFWTGLKPPSSIDIDKLFRPRP